MDLGMNTKDYIYFQPAYMHTLLIYAFCNVNDLSWGTKGRDSETSRSAILDKFLSYKIKFVAYFIVFNVFFMLSFAIIDESDKT